MRLPGFLLLVSAALIGVGSAAPAQNAIERAMVRIATVSYEPDYRNPWSAGSTTSGVGAGFVIAGNRIMTNAHVVSNAGLITVEREGDPRRYVATPLFTAHDCDLALLSVEDERFFEGMTALEFGGLPALESTVLAFGYPVGGQRLSVTRGVVSRIDFQTYSHSGVDSHLAVQIDAAINPGNSGGPVIQDGKVVGVAFQGYSGDVAQNVGYMIPVPVVERFLRDISDGQYDRYVDLAIGYFRLLNPAQRKSLGLEDDGLGILVTDVFAEASADGQLKIGDVLMAIDGYPITAAGFVEIDGDLVEMPEIVERKVKGETIALSLLRNGKPMAVSFPLKGIWPMSMNANIYGRELSFLVYGGLVFQPLSKAVMAAHEIKDIRVRYFFEKFIERQLYSKFPEVIVLTQILPDPVNTDLQGLLHGIVESVDGQPVTTLASMAALLDGKRESHIIRFLGSGRPLVLETAAVKEAKDRIRDNYGLTLEERVLPPEKF